MKPKWDGVLTVALVACALVTTASVAHREFIAPLSAAKAPASKPVLIDDWRVEPHQGMMLGSPGAPIQLIEFADFECPYCATFQTTLKALRTRYPSQVSVTYVHYPLPMHRFALPAARAAECAGDQGRFEVMHDLLFAGQRSFGSRPWNDYAAEAGVPDLSAFEACSKNENPVSRIDGGKQLAERHGIQATPTVMINGWKLARPPSLKELDGMVQAILSGKPPVSDDTVGRSMFEWLIGDE